MKGKPVPVPVPASRPYWDAARRHQLWLPKCKDTGKYFFHPRTRSPFTGGEVTWAQASGRGKLASFVIVHRPPPGFEAEAPYIVALVELTEGPRLTTNLVDVEATPEAIEVGMELEVVFEERGTVTLPQFRPLKVGANND